MPLSLSEKQEIVAEVAQVAADAHSVVAAEYSGLTVEEMTELRAKARDTGVYLRVIKNSLARRAFENTDFDCMRERLVGPLVLAFSQEDPGAAARLVRDFAKEHNRLVPMMAAVDGELLEAGDLGRLANLPTREQALAILLGTLRAPLDKFARTLNEVPGKLVRTVAAIRDQKEAA